MDRSLNEYWNPGNPVRKVKYKEFTRIYQRQCFGVKVKKLCFKDSIPKALSRKKTVQVSFTVSIVHKPTIANYFHFQIEVIDSETKKPITWGKSAYQKAISKKIFDRILMHAEIVEKNWNRAWRLKDYLSLS